LAKKTWSCDLQELLFIPEHSRNSSCLEQRQWEKKTPVSSIQPTFEMLPCLCIHFSNV